MDVPELQEMDDYANASVYLMWRCAKADDDGRSLRALHTVMQSSFDRLEVIRSTIAICKECVEESVGPDLIPQVDSGSPWGRAFMRAARAMRASREIFTHKARKENG